MQADCRKTHGLPSWNWGAVLVPGPAEDPRGLGSQMGWSSYATVVEGRRMLMLQRWMPEVQLCSLLFCCDNICQSSWGKTLRTLREILRKIRLQTPSTADFKRYMNVGTPLEARCFLMSLSVPYQLNPLVECPMRGRCTLAVWGKHKNISEKCQWELVRLHHFLCLTEHSWGRSNCRRKVRSLYC